MHSQAVGASVYAPRWAPLGHISQGCPSKNRRGGFTSVRGHACPAKQVLMALNSEVHHLCIQTF